MAPKAEFSFEIPSRLDDEPNATSRQKSFFQHQLMEIDSDSFSDAQMEELGNWRATSLIDRLIEIKEGVESGKIEIKRGAFGKSLGRFIGMLIYPIPAHSSCDRAYPNAPVVVQTSARKHISRRRRIMIWRLLWLSQCFMLLAACAGISGKDALPTPEPFIQQVFFATTRAAALDDNSRHMFTTDRGPLQYGLITATFYQQTLYARQEAAKADPDTTGIASTKRAMLADFKLFHEKEFLQSLAQQLATEQHRYALVYIHGYKRSFVQTILTTAQLGLDLAFPGPVIVFSWPSRQSIFGYTEDWNNLLWSTPAFREVLETLHASRDIDTIHLIAHSMGNSALTEALLNIDANRGAGKEWRFGEIVLLAPDIDRDLFIRDYGPRLANLPSRISLYVSADDLPLLFSQRVNGYPRLGDARAGIPVISGIETIDVSETITVTSGHGYYEESDTVIGDLRQLIIEGHGADQRSGLHQQSSPTGDYWLLRK